MLRIVPSENTAAARKYFDDALVHEDCVDGEQPSAPGQWRGRGAELLGLSGDVTRRDFGKMCDNLRPGTKEPLTPRSRADRTPGWDFEFSVPKGVTILHALGGDKGVLEAVLLSVRETMSDIEGDALTRVRRGGAAADRSTGNLVWAEFVHYTARPVDKVADPQDHVHCYVFNVTHDPVEDRFKALQPFRVMWSKPYFEALFLSRLAGRLHDLGYETEPKGPFWDVAGMSSLVDKFCRRTDRIEAVADERGVTNARDKAELGAKTRERKSHDAPESLEQEWAGRLNDEDRQTLRSVLHGRGTGLIGERSAGEPTPKPPDRLPEGPALADSHRVQADALDIQMSPTFVPSSPDLTRTDTARTPERDTHDRSVEPEAEDPNPVSDDGDSRAVGGPELDHGERGRPHDHGKQSAEASRGPEHPSLDTHDSDETGGEPETEGPRDSSRRGDREEARNSRGPSDGDQQSRAGEDRHGGSENGRHEQASSGSRRDDGPDSTRMGNGEGTKRAATGGRHVREIADRALGRVFERSAVVPERALLSEALRLAPGRVTEEQLRAEFDRRGLIRRAKGGTVMVTTPEVLQEEQHMVKLASEGRGRWRPLAEKPVEDGKHALTPDQLLAVNHVLRSRDFVTIVEGPAADGESPMLEAVRKELWESGGPLASVLPDRLLVVGPTPAASRGVRNQPGYQDAETVAKFLAESNQKSFGRKATERLMPDRVVWVREGSLVGTTAMVGLMEQCRSSGVRLVIAHDPAQLRSVARGSCVPVLKDKEHAGLPSAKVEAVRRQQDNLKEAVQALSEGKAGEAFLRLRNTGAIKEEDREVVAKQAAADYIQCTRLGKKTALVTPTREEKAELTEAVRSQLKEEGRVKKERAFTQLVPAEGSAHDKSSSDFYHRGQVVQFHQNAIGFPAGTRWNVMASACGVVMVSADRSAESGPYPKRPLLDINVRPLPLGKADRFEVYEKKTIEIGIGDEVRITRNGRTFSAKEAALYEAIGSTRYPKRDLNCGSVSRVKRFTSHGGLHLENGLVVTKGYGHIEHGYCTTTFGAGRADCVVLCQTKGSGRAASAEQFYSALSNAKESATVYTDDVQFLREQMGRTAERLAAMDLVKPTAADEHVRRDAPQAREDEKRREDHGRASGRKDKGFERERT